MSCAEFMMTRLSETDAQALTTMLNDLEAHRLEVRLAPSRRRDRRDTDMIRVVVDHGPRWYRKLCAAHPSSRGVRRGKFDTRVRHRNILRALELMIAGQAAGKYAPELRRIAASIK